MWGLAIATVILLYYYNNTIFNGFQKMKYYFKMYILYYILCMLLTIFCLPFMLVRWKHYSNGLLTAHMMKHITKLYGIEWRLRNWEVIKENQGAIIMANHQNAFDILGIFNIWDYFQRLVVVSKKSVLYSGPFGVAAYLSDTVFIDRNKPKEAYKMLENTSRIINENKVNIWIFPEGTRNSKEKTKMLPFKLGGFKMAVAAQAPIIPIVYSPYYFIDESKYIFDKGYMLIQCLEPVSTVGLTMDDVLALADRLRDVMVRVYDELSKEILADSRAEKLND